MVHKHGRTSGLSAIPDFKFGPDHLFFAGLFLEKIWHEAEPNYKCRQSRPAGSHWTGSSCRLSHLCGRRALAGSIDLLISANFAFNQSAGDLRPSTISGTPGGEQPLFLIVFSFPVSSSPCHYPGMETRVKCAFLCDPRAAGGTLRNP